MMLNCCLGMRNVTDGVSGAAGGAGNIVSCGNVVGKKQIQINFRFSIDVKQL